MPRTRTHLRTWTKKDFVVQAYIGSGPGGQHRNKVATCIRITDKETGISVCCEEHKSQSRNKTTAFRRLAKLLIAHHYPKKPKERAPCTTRIRTYHEPRATVTDDRTGESYPYDDVVCSSGIDKVLDDCVRHGVTPERACRDD